MRVPLSWLREHCPTRLPPAEVAELLTAHGLKVESLLHPWAGLGGIRVARVLEVRDHPKADRLCIAVVDDEGGERDVVVGVRNFKPGDLVPYAPPGATLPGLEGPLERREIRGVASEGMLCSPKELGISPDHSSILVLPEDGQPGADLREYLHLDETVLDVEVVPNRPDLLSVVGVARELAAATGEDLALPDTSVTESIEKASSVVTVEVQDRDRCSRYVARVIRGVTPGPSPLFAHVRLTACGMRPLSDVVDATNYVMLETGQPLHPFDLAKLAGPGIVVRRAAKGERLVTIDGVERTFIDDDLLIADVERAVAIAGVMGGGDTEVTADSRNVLLESANFLPVGIFRTARRLGLRTEASIRFERGVDPEAAGPAASRAAALIAEWGGGRVLAGAAGVADPTEPRSVSVRPARVRMLLGVDVSSGEVREALGRLRLPAAEEDDRIEVEVPSYRVDLEREVDLIEEVGRTIGYDRIPSTLPGVKQAGGLHRDQWIRRRVRDLLAGAGLWEAQSTSLASAADVELFQAARGPGVSLANPISEEEGYLRSSLVPGLLRAARRNVSHRRFSVRLFDVGRTFVAGDPDPVEDERVAVLLTGPAVEGWPGEGGEQDFLDAKGVLEHLLGGLGVTWSPDDPAASPYHAGRSAVVGIGEESIGEVGELDPRVAGGFDLPGRVAAFELRVAPLTAAAPTEVVFADVSRFPPVHRDLAFLVGSRVSAGEVRDALVEAAGDLLDRALLFDVFEGDPLPPGKKSLAFSVDLRASDRTLTDDEADERVRAIADRLRADFGAELRAG